MGYHVVAQLLPLCQTGLAVFTVFQLGLVKYVAGVHMHVVYNDRRAVVEGQLIAAETLRHQHVVGMAELAEALLPGHALALAQRDAVLPAGAKPVALKLLVLRVQQVNLLAGHIKAYGPRPLVELVAVFKHYRQLVVIVEVFLKEHQVIAALSQIFTYAHRTGTARTLGIDIKHQDFLGQAVHI